MLNYSCLIGRPKTFCAINQLTQLRNVGELAPEMYGESLKERSVNSGYKIFQVFTTPVEFELGEGGKG